MAEIYKFNNLKLTKPHFSRGNVKLGHLVNWSLPARAVIIDGKLYVICPGATQWCRENCYARKGHFTTLTNGVPRIQLLYAENLKWSERDDFPDAAISAIRERLWKNEKHLVRLHVSGDFYSVEYVNKWREVIRRMPDVHFYAYTKSWRTNVHEGDVEDLKEYGITAAELNRRNGRIYAALKTLKELPNFNLMISTDEYTGPPPASSREAGIERTWSPGGVLCNYQRNGILCEKCTWCWNPRSRVNVYFAPH